MTREQSRGRGSGGGTVENWLSWLTGYLGPERNCLGASLKVSIFKDILGEREVCTRAFAEIQLLSFCVSKFNFLLLKSTQNSQFSGHL